MTQPLSGRIALVTGASRGIGYAAALALARAGAHVVAVARTVGGLEELDDAVRAAGGSATLMPLDIRDSEGLYRLAAALNERYGRLDVLVGNAALGAVPSPLDHIEPKAWDDMMAVNVTANWHLIRAMGPLLKRAEAGRAVFVTSGAATHRPRLLGSIFGIEGGARRTGADLRGETSATRVRVNLFNPGPTRTRMRALVMPGRGPDDAAGTRDRGRKDCRSVPAGFHRNRPAVRFPRRQTAGVQAARLNTSW